MTGIMDGDQDHLHHRLLRQNKKQTTTALTMYLIGCGFSAVALVGISLCNSMPAVGYVILLIAVLIVIRKLAIVELYDSTMLISRGLAKPHKGVLVNIVHPFIDFVCIILAYVITAELLLNTCRIYLLFLCAFAPVALLLCVSGVYRVFWLRAGLHNYCHLALVLIGGSCLACVLTYFFCYHELEVIFGVTPRWYLAGCLMFSLLNLVFILLERLLLHYAEGFWFRKLYLQCQKRDSIQRILIYGGGLMCRVYISFLFVSNSREFSEEVVGIIDDDPALQGLQVNGFRVFGSALEIERIYQKCPFDKIVIATNRASEEGLSHLPPGQLLHHADDAHARGDGLAGEMSLVDGVPGVEPQVILRRAVRRRSAFDEVEIVLEFHKGCFAGKGSESRVQSNQARLKLLCQDASCLIKKNHRFHGVPIISNEVRNLAVARGALSRKISPSVEMTASLVRASHTASGKPEGAAPAYSSFLYSSASTLWYWHSSTMKACMLR